MEHILRKFYLWIDENYAMGMLCGDVNSVVKHYLNETNKEKGKTLQSTHNLIFVKMNDTEKAQFRMGCLIEAGKIKQSLNAHPEVEGYEGKGVVEIAKEFAAFVLNEAEN